MDRPRALKFVVAALAVAVAATVLVVTVITTTGQSLSASERALGALSAWSSYATALGASLLVWLAIVAGFEARREFRTGHRPVVGISGARFTSEGVDVRVENVGPGAMVNLHLRLWVGFAGGIAPAPPDLGELIEQSLQEATATEATFESDLSALAPGGTRPELLRYGPRASIYAPSWAGGWGVVVWDAKATDLFGTKHPGSGYFLVEGEPTVDE